MQGPDQTEPVLQVDNARRTQLPSFVDDARLDKSLLQFAASFFLVLLLDKY